MRRISTFAAVLLILLGRAECAESAESAESAASAEARDSLIRDFQEQRILELAQKLGDPSEFGQDYAATLIAASLRIKTDQKLSDLPQLMCVDRWRRILYRWQTVTAEIEDLRIGGATMLEHAAKRSVLNVETFLAPLAVRIPARASGMSKDTVSAVDRLLSQAKRQLAAADAEATRSGFRPIGYHGTEALARELTETHRLLKEQFRYSGSSATTRLLLKFCKDPWKEFHEDP